MIVDLNSRALPRLTATVGTLQDASAAVRAHIKKYDLGASDMRHGFGNVCDEGGDVVARVSYNGRIWNLDGTEHTS